MVIATDPKGVPTDDDTNAASSAASDTVTVVITVTPVDEAPLFTMGGTAVSFNEVTGEIGTMLGAAYVANDPEDSNGAPTLGIRGADRSKFDFDATNGELKFKAKPNYEMPGDADKDNVYEVTITATDTTDNIGTRDVKVTVTNGEEGGTVTLSQPRPRVGLEIAASYDDPDGGEAGPSWEWWRSTDNTLSNAPAPTIDDTATELPAADWEKIKDANSATYMPVHDNDAAEKSDVGRYLVAVVRYTDAKENTDEETKDIARAVSANPVARDTRNRAPVFADQDGDTPGVQNETTTRKVAENTKALASDDAVVDDDAADNVGKSVMAEDPDPNADPLIYTLGGDDAAKFRVRDNGQIEVGAGTTLDYETKDHLHGHGHGRGLLQR